MELSNFELLDHRLISINFKANPDFSQAEDGMIQLSVQGESKVAREQDKNSAQVYLTLSFYNDGRVENPPFMCTIEYAGTFAWKETIDEGTLSQLFEVNCPAILTSFIRPLLFQITAMSGIPPISLPLLDFRKK